MPTGAGRLGGFPVALSLPSAVWQSRTGGSGARGQKVEKFLIRRSMSRNPTDFCFHIVRGKVGRQIRDLYYTQFVL